MGKSPQPGRRVCIGSQLSEAGVSLLEALVAVAISSVIAVGVASLLALTMRSVTAITQLGERTQLAASLGPLFSSSAKCSRTTLFKPAPIVLPSGVNQLTLTSLGLTDPSGNVQTWIQNNTNYSGLNVQNLQLVRTLPTPLSTRIDPALGDIDLYALSLNFDSQVSGGVTAPSSLRRQSFPFFAWIQSSSGALQSCYGGNDQDQVEYMCDQLGGTFVATATPPCQQQAFVTKLRLTAARYTSFQAATATPRNGAFTSVANYITFNEYKIVAPACPAGSRAVDCSVTMETQTGRIEELTTATYDWDHGDPALAAMLPAFGNPKVSWVIAYFDRLNSNACTLRIANATIEGAWTDWSPTVTCASHAPIAVPPSVIQN